MSWRPDEQTDENIRNMVDALFAVAPEVLGIDEFITGCTVTDIDVYGAGVGTLPRFIQCEIREYLHPVLYCGGIPGFAVNTEVSVIHLRDGNRYEVAGPSGGGGIAGVTIHDHSTNLLGGQNLRQILEHEYEDAAALTIAAGVITRTQVYHRVDTQGGGATDNLDTINGGTEGDILVIRPENDARTIVVRHNIGNIWLINGSDITLDDAEDHLLLIYDGTVWSSLGDASGLAAGLPCQVAVVRGCVITEYPDPDDAFVNANLAGDVVLVPEGTWTLSDPHTMTNSTSVVGIGGHPEDCLLDAPASVAAGVAGNTLITMGNDCRIYGVNIQYTRNSAFPCSAVAIVATSLIDQCWLYAENTFNGGTGVALSQTGGIVTLCVIQGVASTGGGGGYGVQISGGEIWRSECLGSANTGSGRGIYATAACEINYTDGDGVDTAGTGYGIYVSGGVVTVRHGLFRGDTFDVIRTGGTFETYNVQYVTFSGAVTKTAGDRVAFNEAAVAPLGTASWYGTSWHDTAADHNWLKIRNITDTLWYNVNSGLHEHVYQEDVSAKTDGAKVNFLTVHEFAPETTMVFQNGDLIQPTVDYTEDATFDAVTFTVAPAAVDIVIFAYVIA
jgi:hypothetical protein